VAAEAVVAAETAVEAAVVVVEAAAAAAAAVVATAVAVAAGEGGVAGAVAVVLARQWTPPPGAGATCVTGSEWSSQRVYPPAEPHSYARQADRAKHSASHPLRVPSQAAVSYFERPAERQ